MEARVPDASRGTAWRQGQALQRKTLPLPPNPDPDSMGQTCIGRAAVESLLRARQGDHKSAVCRTKILQRAGTASRKSDALRRV